MNVRLRLFAAVRDIVGDATQDLELDRGATPRVVWKRLAANHPELRSHDIPMIAVNEEYAEADTELQDGDELAFIPPVSGG